MISADNPFGHLPEGTAIAESVRIQALQARAKLFLAEIMETLTAVPSIHLRSMLCDVVDDVTAAFSPIDKAHTQLEEVCDFYEAKREAEHERIERENVRSL